MMGAGVIVRNADFGPIPGICGCVVGRVVEVESVGVRGRTRRPVLDFRPTVGVIVAVCAGPATYVALVGRSCPAGWFRPGVRGCTPMMGGGLVVRNVESGGAGLLSGIFIAVDERAVFGCCLPRRRISCVNVYEPAGHVVRGLAPIVGLPGVVRNAECRVEPQCGV